MKNCLMERVKIYILKLKYINIVLTFERNILVKKKLRNKAKNK